LIYSVLCKTLNYVDARQKQASNYLGLDSSEPKKPLLDGGPLMEGATWGISLPTWLRHQKLALAVIATSLEGSKTNFRLIIYSHNFTIPENLAEIGSIRICT